MTKRILSVKDLTISFETKAGDIKAVNKINFDIFEKEIFALVGESGCGKSTTAKALMRLIEEPGKITDGEMYFNGKDLLQLKEEEMVRVRGKEIGMIFQNPLDSLNPVYTVGKQISEAILLDNVPKDEAWKRAVDILKDVKISDAEYRAKSFPHELSGGMRQRVMIGMMLSRNPKLIIADEPTTALDVTIQAQILRLINELKEEFSTSVLIITHDFGIVAEVADRVGVMYAGEIIEIGDVYSIFENPLHPYTKLLMRALPKYTKNEGRLEAIAGSVPNLLETSKGCNFYARCPYVKDICATTKPNFSEVHKGHFSACHLGGLVDETAS